MIDSRKLVITPSDYKKLFQEMNKEALINELNSLSSQEFRRLKRKVERKCQ